MRAKLRAAARSPVPFAPTLGVADLLPAEKRPTRSERQESVLKSVAILRVSIPRVQRPREKNVNSAGEKQQVTTPGQPTPFSYPLRR